MTENITQELKSDLETLNNLISWEKPFSIVTEKGIWTCKNLNNELAKIILQERKNVMAQQIKYERDLIQWKLI